MSNYFYAFVLLFFLGSCSENRETLFKKVAPAQSNITFENTLTEQQNLNILDYLYYYNGGGVAIGDINNDGLPDIYFSGNQVPNKLYLNKGNMVFEDITNQAGVAGNSDWNTGVAMADVNGDGWLDIYVCAVVGVNGLYGYNELFINKGDGTFEEQAEAYGLDYANYSSSAVFLDYDADGDLDIYLLNHAVHSEHSFGNANLRHKRHPESGDKLLRNDNNRFVDVSEKAGIFGGGNGYGLGVCVADFNQDGFPDIYVGNDFHEDDYFYLNNGDGTFREALKEYFGHISRFSMGSDVADINRDGFPDIMSLDMLPEEEKPLKASAGDDDYSMMKYRTERLGYHYQYTRNMLHINQGGKAFSEFALLSGVAATDWSWGALFGDYNQDGELDLFVSNGIMKRPNDLDYINFISSDQIKNKLSQTKLVDIQVLDSMPNGILPNYIFKGKKGIRFEKMDDWIPEEDTYSNGLAYGDLDQDGDLDLVVNNINAVPTIYENKIDDKGQYLTIKLNYNDKNPVGIGAKIFSFDSTGRQYREFFTVRGFQSSSEPIIHFGYSSEVKKIDSLWIVWPDRSFQVLKNVELNQRINIGAEKNRQPFDNKKLHKKQTPLFEKVPDDLGLKFEHEENHFIDFNIQKLMPYMVSDRGPATAVGDIDGDGREDVFFGNSKHKRASVFIQKSGTFIQKEYMSLAQDSIFEDIDAVISDVNNDNKNEIVVVSGGGQFTAKSRVLKDRIYLPSNAQFSQKFLAEYFTNSSVIKLYDLDGDGDLDAFVGGGANVVEFGKSPPSYLLKNEGNRFIVHQTWDIGMTTDAVWSDFNGDGKQDLIVVGEWMQPTFLENREGKMKDVSEQYVAGKQHGLWQSITPYDIDHDGDMDYLLGNWGTNSKLLASKKHPLLMYSGDIDENGSIEMVVAVYKKGTYYSTKGLDEFAEQLIYLRKKFPNYESFAGKNIYEIFGDKLDKMDVLKVHILSSGYLENKQNHYTFVPFKDALQVSPITDFLVYDFDGDGKDEALCAGNYFGVTPYHSRFDGLSGALIKDVETVVLGQEIGLDLSQKAVRHLNILRVEDKQYVLVTFNNEKAALYEIKKN